MYEELVEEAYYILEKVLLTDERRQFTQTISIGIGVSVLAICISVTYGLRPIKKLKEIKNA